MTENNDEDLTKKKTTVNAREIERKSSPVPVLQFPDVCETPSEAEPIPIPYPNIAKSSDAKNGSKKVKVEGKEVSIKESDYVKSSGDEPGTDKETSWDAAESMTKTITRTVKKHPFLIAIIALILVLVVMVCLLNVLSTPIPYDEPANCIRAHLTQIINV
jgi:hypothetical protein